MNERRKRRLVAYAVILGLLTIGVAVRRPFASRRPALPGTFLVLPYVQWGEESRPSGVVTLLWQTEDRDAEWSVEIKASPTIPWTKAGVPVGRPYDGGPNAGPRRLYRAVLSGLAAGEEFSYRLRRGGQPAFEAKGRAPKGPGQAHRFVAFGDGGADSWEQREVAYRASLARPDYVMVTGDIAYYKGLMSDYLDKFFPIYNNDVASPSTGAPLLRSTPFLVAPGNHDLLERDLDQFPDALAYYLVWSLPLNGPLVEPGSPSSPTLRGSAPHRQTFLERAGPAYPRMANYSFDCGDVHWTVLDTNPYANWSEPALRSWLEQDLAAAQKAPWRFVAFHQPPFHSSKTHSDEQRTRVLATLFEQYRVNIVFCGHIHNYQRSYPLRFVPEADADGRAAVEPSGHVKGRWTLDKVFDGKSQTRPDGVIYLVTGAGGARLYNQDQHDDASSWEDFTARFVSNIHSLTVVDVDAARLTVRQVSGDGKELDRFEVTRPLDDAPSNSRPPSTAVQ